MQNSTLFALLLMIAMLGFLFLVVVALYVLLFQPWLRAIMHGLSVTMLQIVGMRLRGNSPSLLIDACVSLRRKGASITIVDVENVYIDHKSRISTSDDLARWVKKNVDQD